MKTLRSALLWFVGGLHFFLLFLILSFGLIFINPRRLYPAVRLFMRMQLFVMGVRVRAGGYDRFDRQVSYLIMGNHESLFDVFLIPVALPLHAVGIEAAYHFAIPLWGRLARRWGNIPIRRSNLGEAKQTLDDAAGVLQSGTSIVILPEGHRTLTGSLGPFKKGPFHLAAAAGADILPFAMSGLYEYRRKGGWQLTPLTAHVEFGRPIPYDTFKDDEIAAIRHRVRREIMALKEIADGKRKGL